MGKISSFVPYFLVFWLMWGEGGGGFTFMRSRLVLGRSKMPFSSNENLFCASFFMVSMVS